MNQIIIGFLLVIGIILFTCTALQLITQNKTTINYQISFIYFLLGYFLIYDWLYQINYLQKISFIMYTDISASFLLGPFLYSYTKKIAGKPDTSLLKSFIQYLPGIIMLCYCLLSNPGSDDSVAGAFFPAGHKNFVIINILSFSCDLSLMTYLILSAKIIHSMMKNEELIYSYKIRYNFYFYLISILTFLLFFASYFIENNKLIGIGLLINGLNGIYYFLFSYRYPEYTQKVIKPLNIKKSKISLNNINIDDMIKKLGRLIEYDKVYRSPEISIQNLSNLLSIKTYELSLILNDYMNTNFRNLINSNRLKDAQALLTDDIGKTVLEIAYEVGFNSKSSFNDLFVKETGISPTEFRKKYKK